MDMDLLPGLHVLEGQPQMKTAKLCSPKRATNEYLQEIGDQERQHHAQIHPHLFNPKHLVEERHEQFQRARDHSKAEDGEQRTYQAR